MEKISEQQWIDYFTIAKNANVPRDQIVNFIQSGYIPLPWQLKFHGIAREADKTDGAVKIGVGGARGPGKSHCVFAQIALDDCQRVSNLKGLFLRQTGKAAKESFEDLIFAVLTGVIKYNYNKSSTILEFSNSSRIVLGGFENEADIDKYVGIEYDFIAIEELNQLSQDKIDKLLGSMRTSKTNWRPRLYTSFNPGGIGHQFVKDLFVVPFKEQREIKTRFIPAIYKDNPYLNVEYIEYLKELKGDLGKAWREGEWDLFEGQYFNEWNTEKHTCPPFPIPLGWRRFRAYDHGRAAPACCKWYALDQDGRVWVYRELYLTGMNIDYIASEINRLSQGEEYQYSIADPSIFAHTGFVDKTGGQTIAEVFARYGVQFYPGSNRRVDGWNILHQYLYWSEYQLPKIIYFKTCYNSIRTLPALIHDEHRPEDVDTRCEDHAPDTDRYFLMSLHEAKAEVPKSDIEKKLDELKQKDSMLSQLAELYLPG